MLNKQALNFLGTAAASAVGLLTAKFLESKETRQKLIENAKDIGEDVGTAMGKGLDLFAETADKGIKRLFG